MTHKKATSPKEKTIDKKIAVFIVAVFFFGIAPLFAQQEVSPMGAVSTAIYDYEKSSNGTETYIPKIKGHHEFSFGEGLGKLSFDYEGIDISQIPELAPLAVPDAQGIAGTGRGISVQKIENEVAATAGETRVEVLGSVWRFGPDGLYFTTSTLLTLPYTCPEGILEEQINLFWYDEKNLSWILMPKVSQDFYTHTITAKIQHFTDTAAGILISRKDEGGSLAGLGGTRSETVDPYFGTLLMDSVEAQIPARGIGIELHSNLNSDYLYSSSVNAPLLPTLSSTMTASGLLCVNSKNASMYEYADGWSYQLPSCIFGTDSVLSMTIPGGTSYNLSAVLQAFADMVSTTDVNIDRYIAKKSGTTLTVRIPEAGYSCRFTISTHVVDGDYFSKATTARLFYPDGRQAEFASTGLISKLYDAALINSETFTYNASSQLQQINHSDTRALKIYKYAYSTDQYRITYVLSSSTSRTRLNPGDLFLQRKTINASNRVIKIEALNTVPISSAITDFSLTSETEDDYCTALRATTYSYSLSSAVVNNSITVTSPGNGYTRYIFDKSFNPYGYVSYVTNETDPPSPPVYSYTYYYENKPKVKQILRKERADATEFAQEDYTYASGCGIAYYTSAHTQNTSGTAPTWRDGYPLTTTIITNRNSGGTVTPLIKRELTFEHTGIVPAKEYKGVSAENIWEYTNGYNFYAKTTRTFVKVLSASIAGNYRPYVTSEYVGNSTTPRYRTTQSYDDQGRHVKAVNSLSGISYLVYLNGTNTDSVFSDNPYSANNNFTDNLVKGFSIVAGSATEQTTGSYLKTYKKFDTSLRLLEAKTLEYTATGTAKPKTTVYGWNTTTNTLTSITEPWGDTSTAVTTLVYGTGWKTSYIASETKELGANIGSGDKIVSSYEYDLAGRRLEEGSVVKDAQNVIIDAAKYPAASIRLECDALGRVTKRYRAVGSTETLLARYTYGKDIDGLWARETDAKGFSTYVRYDFYGNPLAETKYKPDTDSRDATYTGTGTAIGTRQWTWDAALPGLVKSATADLDAAQATHLYAKYTYDKVGRVTLVQSGASPSSYSTMHVTTYDDILKTVTVDTYRNDSTFVQNITTYNGLGRLISDRSWIGVNGGGSQRTTYYAYNLAGQVTTKTMPNAEQYAYTYTRAGSVETEVYPMGRGTKRYSYYPDGKIKTITELNGDVVTYAYTKAGQERTRATSSTRSPIPDSLLVTKSYCQYGLAEVKEQRAGEATPSQVIAYEYGADGRIVKESRTVPTPVGSRTAMVQRTYDLAGNPASVAVTGFGGYLKAVDYATPYFGGTGYNNNENTLAATDASLNLIGRTGVNYWGGMESISYGTSGGTSVFGYDTYLHLNSIDNPGTLCDGSYTYDRVGNVIARDGTNYTYDGMNRLFTGAGTTYGYDEIGNITSSTGADPSSFSYELIGGRDSMLLRGITRTNTHSVTDDTERGWITGIDTRYSDLRWDVYGRLEAIVDLARGQSGTQEDTYRYYPDGLRYRKDETATTGSITTSLYLYEGNDILLKEMLEGTAWKTAQVNVRLGGVEIGRYVNDYASGTERLEYVWRDNVGSRRAVSDTVGTVKAKIDYSVWGIPTVTNYDGYDGSLDVSYTGKEKDATGLYYFNARYYDSSVGRFYSEDPVRSGSNWFIYCGNNPLSYVDPWGLWTNRSDGSFIAEPGDTLWGLGKDTGRDWKSSDFSGDPTKLQVGERVGFGPQTTGNSDKTIDSNWDAVTYYYSGAGGSVNLGNQTIAALKNSPDQASHDGRITSGQTDSLSGNYAVDLTGAMYHVGKTTVDYETTLGGKFGVTTFTAFVGDGFWDIAGGDDGPGPAGELPFGTPYSYNTYSWTESFATPAQSTGCQE